MKSGRNKSHAVQKIEYDIEKEFLILKLNAKLEKGRDYTLFMKFTSLLTNDESRGFYRFSYKENGVTKYKHISFSYLK